jgi:hypothetical protein
VTVAHNQCVNGLVIDIRNHQGKQCTLRFISEDKDKSLKSLWADKVFERFGSHEDIWKVAADRERKRTQERQEQGEEPM